MRRRFGLLPARCVPATNARHLREIILSLFTMLIAGDGVSIHTRNSGRRSSCPAGTFGSGGVENQWSLWGDCMGFVAWSVGEQYS